MKRLPSVAAVLVALLLLGADAPKSDHQLIQGEWKVVSIVRHGTPDTIPEGLSVTFKGDEMWSGFLRPPFRLDTESKPKRILQTVTFGSEQKYWVPGIYELSKDELVIRWGKISPDEKLLEWPKEFTTKEGDFGFMMKMERVKH